MQRNKVVKLLTILLSTSTVGIINYSDVKAEEIKVVASNTNVEAVINNLKNIGDSVMTETSSTMEDVNNSIVAEISAQKKLTIDEYKLKSATELAEMVRTKQITSEELVNIAYEIIESENPNYNAVITTRKELALEEAKNIQDVGQPFIGVPFLVKGIGHTVSGGENTNGLMVNAGKPLSKTDGSYTKKYKELGFIVLGQTNYPELALRNITTSELYGTTTNGWNINYHSGGSSGGSATAISSGMVPVSSGSDAGGSIRIPASWNGLIGLKTSRGMTDNAKKETQTPAVHFPITKSVQDTITLFDYLKKAEYDSPEIKDLKSLKIGYTTKSPMGTEVSEDAINAVMESVQFLREQGFVVEEVENPIDGREVMKDYTILSIGNGGLVGTRFENNLIEKNLTKENVDPLVWALYVTNKEYDKKKLKEDVTKSWANIEKYKNTMEMFHKEYPILLTSTTATTAPLKTETLIDNKDKEDLYNIENIVNEERFDLLYRQWEPMLKLTPFTQIANLTGEPAISLPTYVSKENLPLGIMLNTYWGGDRTLLQFASLFESNNMLKIKDNYTKKGESEKHEIPVYDLNGDEDQDGVSNKDELELGTDPADKESYPTSKGQGTKHEVPVHDLNGDEDQDGVSNKDELELGTDPTDKESYPTSKGQGIKHEVPVYDLNGDEDQDGVSNKDELEQGTDPADKESYPTSKGQGIKHEVPAYDLNGDEDQDGVSNKDELEQGTDPTDKESYPTSKGQGTKHEIPVYDLNGDEDQDGVSNKDELELGTDPADKESYPTSKGQGTKHEVPVYDIVREDNAPNFILASKETNIENIKINKEKQLLSKTGIVDKTTSLPIIIIIGIVGYLIRKRKNKYERH